MFAMSHKHISELQKAVQQFKIEHFFKPVEIQ